MGTKHKVVQKRLIEKGQNKFRLCHIEVACIYKSTFSYMEQLAQEKQLQHNVNLINSSKPQATKRYSKCGYQHTNFPRNVQPMEQNVF
jgi:hypothetical protein